MDDVTSMVERFERRRRQLTASGLAHPQTEVAETDVRAVVADAVHRLEQMAVVRTDMRVVDIPESAGLYEAVLAALEETTSS